MVTAYVPAGKKTIDGIESDGMLASGAELGINRDHAGILEVDSQVGAPLAGCLPDSVFEIDNKSITHRPDLWGHLGHGARSGRHPGAQAERPVRPVCSRQAPAAVKIEIEDLEPLPALQRAGVRERRP